MQPVARPVQILPAGRRLLNLLQSLSSGLLDSGPV
jgi:hypothetical protein